MKCRVCARDMIIGRAMFDCACGARVHADCFDKHVVESHKPSFVIGAVNLNDDFVPQKPPAQEAVTAPASASSESR